MVVKELKNLRPFRDEGSLRGTTLVAQYSIKIDGFIGATQFRDNRRTCQQLNDGMKLSLLKSVLMFKDDRRVQP